MGRQLPSWKVRRFFLLMTTIIDVRLMIEEWGDYFQVGVTVMNYEYMNLLTIEGAVAVPGTLIQLQRKATVGEEHLPLPESLSQRGEVSNHLCLETFDPQKF